MAVGVDATYLDFGYDMTFRHPAYPTTSDILHQISADGWAYGINLSARYRPFDWLSFGVLWRSEIEMAVDGTAKFKQKGLISPSAMGFTNGGVSGTEPVPESVTFGVMVKPMDRLSLELDAVWTKWSSYKELVIKYDEAQPFGYELSSAKNWSDAWRFQFGAEYALTKAVDLRVGYVYDQSPINDSYEDYAVPCTDRQIVTLGAGWKVNDSWAVDASYGYLWMSDRDYEARARAGIVDLTREKAHAHMAGMSLTYRF
jgi:long-chain fatty acid transport protein